jgi:hypothetical protein
MAERPKAPVLKTGMAQAIVGSIPTPSAWFFANATPIRRICISPTPNCRAGVVMVESTAQTGEVPEWSNGAAC